MASNTSTPGAATFGRSSSDGDFAGRGGTPTEKPLCQVHEPSRTATDVPGPSPTCIRSAMFWNLPTPKLKGGKPFVVACPMSDEQYRLQQELVDVTSGCGGKRWTRASTMRNAQHYHRRQEAGDGCQDVIGNGRGFSRIEGQPPRGERRFHLEQSKDTRGTQMIFADMGVIQLNGDTRPITTSSQTRCPRHSPRADRRHRRGRIGRKKTSTLREVRQGSVRVLIGSTQKMGTGTNVQKRYRTASPRCTVEAGRGLEQRRARILRQGNENEEVAIYRYVTEGSFDAYMWQALETKARFIGQVITGRQRFPPCRRYRLAGAFLCRGQGNCFRQPGRY